MGTLRRHRTSRVRWLELRNKVTAYRVFASHAWGGQDRALESIDDPHARLFAAEGQAYRRAQWGGPVPELSLVASHAGAGLWLAERALANLENSRCESLDLAEFAAQCKQVAAFGCAGIMEETLGLVARTMYPQLLYRVDACLGARDAPSRDRFWHGVGRAIYFAPTNLPPWRAAPWSGMRMCLREPPHESGQFNALSGFSFALTLVNVRQDEVLETFLEQHGRSMAGCTDGMQAALEVWEYSTGAHADTERHSALPDENHMFERWFSARLHSGYAADYVNNAGEYR